LSHGEIAKLEGFTERQLTNKLLLFSSPIQFGLLELVKIARKPINLGWILLFLAFLSIQSNPSFYEFTNESL
jgi:hypothetical protein